MRHSGARLQHQAGNTSNRNMGTHTSLIHHHKSAVACHTRRVNDHDAPARELGLHAVVEDLERERLRLYACPAKSHGRLGGCLGTSNVAPASCADSGLELMADPVLIPKTTAL